MSCRRVWPRATLQDGRVAASGLPSIVAAWRASCPIQRADFRPIHGSSAPRLEAVTGRALRSACDHVQMRQAATRHFGVMAMLTQRRPAPHTSEVLAVQPGALSKGSGTTQYVASGFDWSREHCASAPQGLRSPQGIAQRPSTGAFPPGHLRHCPEKHVPPLQDVSSAARLQTPLMQAWHSPQAPPQGFFLRSFLPFLCFRASATGASAAAAPSAASRPNPCRRVSPRARAVVKVSKRSVSIVASSLCPRRWPSGLQEVWARQDVRHVPPRGAPSHHPR